MTQIERIFIQNVKGIGIFNYDFTIIANKPTFFVAPNGFGKSSFGIAFESLSPSKISLEKVNFHNNSSENIPSIELTYSQNGFQNTVSADTAKNEISDFFDIFVINNKVRAKARLMNIKGNRIAKSSLEIEKFILINTIPQKIDFNYDYAAQRGAFRPVQKIITNIKSVFSNPQLINSILDEIDFSKFSQIRRRRSLDTLVNQILLLEGSREAIKEQIVRNIIPNYGFEYLNRLSGILEESDLINTQADALLAAIQMINVFNVMNASFKRAQKYLNYKQDSKEYDEIISSVNSTRFVIKSKEEKGKLVIEWPKANEISNGQRDILTFVALLVQARKKFRKENCILIIDEIFDYLDDANLIAFQYYISNFINIVSKEKNLFPIILTHLDPKFFNHFCFSDKRIQVRYLKETNLRTSKEILKLIHLREHPDLKSNFDEFYFHFNPQNSPDIEADFKKHNLNTAWANSARFHKRTQRGLRRYLFEKNSSYDPIAVCVALRVIIEELAYVLLNNAQYQTEFINNINGTKNKLNYCIEKGRNVPEVYFLLGLIYNNSLHLEQGQDISLRLSMKLDNINIENMIKGVYKEYVEMKSAANFA